MADRTDASVSWWATGLLFENCSCQLVCPGHLHFDQLCTHERCKGYWAIRFDEGAYGDLDLGGVRAIKVYDSPQHMIDGGWTEALVIDDSASPAVRDAVDRILTGRAGGPWEKLGQFVGRRLATRYLPIRLEESGAIRRVSVDGLLDASNTDIRGRDRTAPVTFHNLFNQVHAPDQILARGDTTYDDGVIVVGNRGTHGLSSTFSWTVGRT